MKRASAKRRVRWIFFDLGDVLINEDRLRYKIYRMLERRLRELSIELTFEEILDAREDLVLDHADQFPYLTIAKQYMPPQQYQSWHREIKDFKHTHIRNDLILVPGVRSAVRRLHSDYRLGLIADQPHQTLDFLRKHRLLKYFDVHAISAVVNHQKPRKKIFEWAINQAGCSFDEAVMIGDRIDNDIIPAKQLDMFTVLARWNTYRKGFKPRTQKESQYLASLNRIKNWRTEPAHDAERADATVDSVSQISPTIERFG